MAGRRSYIVKRLEIAENTMWGDGVHLLTAAV